MLVPLASTTLELLPEHAAWFPASRTLVVADLHLGKAAAMHAAGLPVAAPDSADVLERLDALLARTQPAHLVISGDFLHGPAHKPHAVLTAIDRFLARHRLPITLVLGNHDTGPGTPLPAWNFHLAPTTEIEGVTLIHHPAEADPDQASLCGHSHPAIALRDGKNTKLRLPAFWLSGQHLVLPAFGSHLGSHLVPLDGDDRFFIVVGDQVVEVPDRLRELSATA